jgi:hypothetical protein
MKKIKEIRQFNYAPFRSRREVPDALVCQKAHVTHMSKTNNTQKSGGKVACHRWNK